jgi:beta-1,4-mannosyltransferase
VQPERYIVSLLPLKTRANRFVSSFSQALCDQGYVVREFNWHSLGLSRTDIVILHWPDEFFAVDRKIAVFKVFIKLTILQITKSLWNAKVIWVAHNATPHGTVRSQSFLTRWFLRSLGGVIFLSGYSRDFIKGLYPEIRNCNALVTVHGHYRDGVATPATPPTEPCGDIRLVHFGQIRPYKNIELLVEVVSSTSSGFQLVVAGIKTDQSLCAAITKNSTPVPHVKLEFRDSPFSDMELEAIIDRGDAVVLPYKHILTSGAALLALSRNRPVLAPNMGSLPELRDAVGHDWVYLYDGDFSQQILVDFREWMLRGKRTCFAPLDAYDFDRVGRDLRDFIEALKGRSKASIPGALLDR